MSRLTTFHSVNISNGIRQNRVSVPKLGMSTQLLIVATPPSSRLASKAWTHYPCLYIAIIHTMSDSVHTAQAEAEKKGDWKDQAPGVEPAPEAPPFSALEDISFPEATGIAAFLSLR